MKLFEILPQNLFSILASKNKEIYVEALFMLRKAFKQEMTIRIVPNLKPFLIDQEALIFHPLV